VLSFDYGSVAPFLPPGSGLPQHDHLTGIGWGLNAAIGNRLNARMTYGYGLTRGVSSLRDNIVIFQVTARVF
jgi:hypothetical protein